MDQPSATETEDVRGDLDEFYDSFPRLEPAFNAALERTLAPRGPDLLYDLVAGFGLARGSAAVDVGCGEGGHSVRLAEQFGFNVLGVDPVPRHIELARGRLAPLDPAVASSIRFEPGNAERLPCDDASIDLVWCRDVLVHVANLDGAYREFRRVLRHGARILVYQTFAGEHLEPREAAWLFGVMRVVPTSADRSRTEAAVAAAGLRIVDRIDLGSEWGEWAEERSGAATGRLLAAARLLRDPERYIGQFGRQAYDIMLGDCLWHVYGLIGKLRAAIYVLAAQ